MYTIGDTDDIIDSRDIIEEHMRLSVERGLLVSNLDDAQEDLDAARRAVADAETDSDRDLAREEVWHERKRRDVAANALAVWDANNGADLEELAEIVSEGESLFPDWTFGETLVRDDYFEVYAQELAEEIGAVDRDAPWPANCIDWSEAAEQLKMDYSELDIHGQTYWGRA